MTHCKHACVKYWNNKNVRIDKITQVDNRKQQKNNKFRENYGTVRVDINKPLGVRDALENYNFNRLSQHQM